MGTPAHHTMGIVTACVDRIGTFLFDFELYQIKL